MSCHKNNFTKLNSFCWNFEAGGWRDESFSQEKVHPCSSCGLGEKWKKEWCMYVTCHETLHLIKIEILSVRKKSSLCKANIAPASDLVPYVGHRGNAALWGDSPGGKFHFAASCLCLRHHRSSPCLLELIQDTSQFQHLVWQEAELKIFSLKFLTIENFE